MPGTSLVNRYRVMPFESVRIVPRLASSLVATTAGASAAATGATPAPIAVAANRARLKPARARPCVGIERILCSPSNVFAANAAPAPTVCMLTDEPCQADSKCKAAELLESLEHSRMKILIIGSGGREHALAWRLAREGMQVLVAPGNGGTPSAVAIAATDLDGLAALAERERVDLTIVGPEAP